MSDEGARLIFYKFKSLANQRWRLVPSDPPPLPLCCAVSECLLVPFRRQDDATPRCAIHTAYHRQPEGPEAAAAPDAAPAVIGVAAVRPEMACRHVDGEVACGDNREFGVRCPAAAVPGATYCAVHLCRRCLQDVAVTCDRDGSHSADAAQFQCTLTECAWPLLAAFQQLDAVDAMSRLVAPDTFEVAMFHVAHAITHRLTVVCGLYGGFVRDFLLRRERANDIDVVVFSSDPLRQTIADGRQLLWDCARQLEACFSTWPADSTECAPTGTARDYLLKLTLHVPRTAHAIRVEFCLDGAYPPGEVDADVNNLLVVSGMSLLPRDVSIPFSPFHALRHVARHQFAYVWQGWTKLSPSRIAKMVHRGWKHTATIPSSVEAANRTDASDTFPPWAICPSIRRGLSISSPSQ